MSTIIKIALRNLTRQKRRNILLGIAMALGMMILVVAGSFSRGVSDIMMNRLIRWMFGHVSINLNERGRTMSGQIFRDKEILLAAIKDEKAAIREADEALGTFGRAIGVGKSDNVMIIGVNTSETVSAETRKELEESYRMVEGDWKDLQSKDVENPAIVSEEKAKYLNVKKGDVIRVRYTDTYSQNQAGRLTVVGIMRNDNIFMSPVVFVEAKNLRAMMNYRPHETGEISMAIYNPEKNATALAERIHSRLKPDIAVIPAAVSRGGRKADVFAFGYRRDDNSKLLISSSVIVVSGELKDGLRNDGVFATEPLAKKLALGPKDEIWLNYKNKFKDKNSESNVKLKVAAVIKPAPGLPENALLINENKFYEFYYDDVPENFGGVDPKMLPEKSVKLYPVLATQWVLLDRTKTTDELKRKFQDMARIKSKATYVDVRTMYESASDVLKLEGVLNLITFSCVMVLFFIILIGVVNTLRMTIKERTREIGTIRAIGMQKCDVRHIFILETFFLALLSSIAGTIAAFIVMQGLTHLTFNLKDNPLGMILINGHLHFVPAAGGILLNVSLILLFAVATAYFPSRTAANLSPAQALRHFE